uniref:Retrotransposon protein, putative, unclassified n=1 Tax=Oryza sativa subsp. japonica TaxID=39947 RepID=Q10GE7_ORYSJ|nr:retrotransposon protein, putative, unclassified [Oryza sativa Japonica Group]
MAEKPPASPSSAGKEGPPKSRIPKLGGSEVHESNIVPITVDKLTPEQKNDLEAMISSKDGEVQQVSDGTAQSGDKGIADGSGDKGDGSQGVQGEDLNPDGNTAQLQFNNFQDRIDYAVQHALINQSGVLVNTLSNMVKSMVDGSIAEYQAIGPVYLPGGVFPNYRPLITNNQPTAQPIAPNAPSAQPTAPVSAPAPAAPSSALGQLINPWLLVREQPQHSGQNENRLTQEQIAAMFLPTQPTIDPVQQQPIQQTPLRQQYQPPSPQVQYQEGGSAQPQFAPQYNQFEPVPQQAQGVPQQRPWVDMIADVMREQFGLKPKDTGNLYRHPYPEWFERVPLPNRFKVPDFSKFSRQDSVSTYEHVSRFLAQCGEASAVDALRVRLFPLSLSGSAFTWFSSLPYGSINSWADLEKQFHSYFYSGVHEMKLSDLTAIRQWHDVPMQDYIQRFREMRNKCYSLSLTDAQLADLAFQGMIAPIREKFSSQDFDSLTHLAQKVTLHEQRFAKARKSFKKVNHVCPYIYKSDDDDDDSEVATAEWVRSKKVIPCQWVKSSGKREIQLPAGHTIPSAEELGKRRYCKWYNSGAHSTNDCKVFRQQIQAAIEGGKIKFDDSKKPMKVDGNPFPVNMVHIAGRTADGGKARGFQVNSAKIMNKYQRKYDKQWQEKYYEQDEGGFDPHWVCEFFRFYWNEGMRLPSIEDCPGCTSFAESSSRSYNRNNRLRQTRVPVHQRLGPNQKRRVQRLRNRECFQEVEQEINHRQKKAKPRHEWHVKKPAVVADKPRANEAKRLAKGKSVVTASCVNMVFTLPAEFGARQADVDEVEKASARQADVDEVEKASGRLVLSPEQVIFEKPEGIENRHLKPLYVNGYVNGKPMSKMMVDGGAAVNLMPYATFRKIGRNNNDLIKTNMVLKDFGGSPSETKGVLNVELTVGSKTIPTTQLKTEIPSYYFEGVVEGSNVYTKDIVDDLDDKQGQGFMSADDLEEIDIGPGDRPRPTFISKNLSPEFRTKLIELLKEFRDCFAWEYYEMPGLSRSIVEHRLPIKPGVRPHQQPPRRCKADMLEPVKAKIKRLYDADFIRPCRYAEWVSSIVPVIKKNGKVKVCIDFRDLNKATPKDEYPMPVADQMVDVASGNKILSFMDGNAGYNQIFMTEKDIHKTAFRCPGAIGLLEWVVMTFGLKSAGATYQRAKNYIYHDLIGWLVEVYIDDVVVKSKEIEDHIADLRKVFERTRKYGLKMNLTKCAFGVSASQFLKFLVHEMGIEITQRSVNAIKKIQPPENKMELQEMIGKINFVRRFISNLSGRLTHYLLSNECTVICKADVIKYMLSALILKGRVGKWIFSLTKFNLRVRTHGRGIGLVIISPRGANFEFAYTIKPYATNNQAEYEAVLKGLQLLNEVEADAIKIMGILCCADQAKVAISEVHEGICGTHQLAHKMKWLLRRAGYFWPTMLEDCFKYYKGCQDCQKFRAIQRAPASAMNPIIKPWSFRGWGIDMIANGQAEASNKSLIKLIKRKISDYPRLWHTRLAEALWSYRMACHGSIQVPPYGHEAVLPWEVRIGSRRTELQNDLTADEYYNLMADEREDLVQSRLRALAKVTKDKERVARHYNKKVVPKSFSEGDLVWKLILPIGTRDNKFGKWSPNWEEPFQIYKVVSKGAYMLQGFDGEVYGRALNGKYLKKYYPSVWVNARSAGVADA